MSVVETSLAAAVCRLPAVRHRTPQSTKRPRELPAFGARWERVERKPFVKYMSTNLVKVLVRGRVMALSLPLLRSNMLCSRPHNLSFHNAFLHSQRCLIRTVCTLSCRQIGQSRLPPLSRCLARHSGHPNDVGWVYVWP
jgi:hypothetical protein